MLYIFLALNCLIACTSGSIFAAALPTEQKINAEISISKKLSKDLEFLQSLLKNDNATLLKWKNSKKNCPILLQRLQDHCDFYISILKNRARKEFWSTTREVARMACDARDILFANENELIKKDNVKPEEKKQCLPDPHQTVASTNEFMQTHLKKEKDALQRLIERSADLHSKTNNKRKKVEFLAYLKALRGNYINEVDKFPYPQETKQLAQEVQSLVTYLEAQVKPFSPLLSAIKEENIMYEPAHIATESELLSQPS